MQRETKPRMYRNHLPTTDVIGDVADLPPPPPGHKWDVSDRRRNHRPVLRTIGRGKRGQPPMTDVDGADLRLAMREMANGTAAYLSALELPAAQRQARREAIKTALGQLALATRLVDAVVERRGGITGDCLGLDEE